MNEAGTRAERDPALAAAGWGVEDGSKVYREHHITLGRIQGAGRRGQKPEIADYVLSHKNTKLAVIEAKAWDKPLTGCPTGEELCAEAGKARFAYSTNGQGMQH